MLHGETYSCEDEASHKQHLLISRCSSASQSIRTTHRRVESMLWLLFPVVLGSGINDAIVCPVYGLEECAGHGRCVRSVRTCICNRRWGGIDCAVELACDPTASRLACNGKGVCINGSCECAQGYAGFLCERDVQCPRHPVSEEACSGEICSAHTCLCRSHRSGAACEHSNSMVRHIPHAH